MRLNYRTLQNSIPVGETEPEDPAELNTRRRETEPEDPAELNTRRRETEPEDPADLYTRR